MKKKYVMKVKDENYSVVERIILNCLVDRMNICSLIKSIKLNFDKEHSYFIVGGEDCSCQRILPVIKRILLDRNIPVNIYSYDAFKSRCSDLDNLLWYSNSNCDGKTHKNYHNNPLIIKHMKRLTTNFVLKKGLFSNHVFCSECDGGFADPVELSSLEGLYRCSFCGADITVKGPLFDEKKTVTHLSIDEQLYLIGLKTMSSTIPSENLEADVYQGEQISIVLGQIPIKEITPKPRKRRTIVVDKVEQICWEFA